jgi:hypothetical protein
MTQSPQHLQDILTRIATTNPLDPPRPTKPTSCTRCNDTHLVEMIGGTYTTPNGLTITATPDQPIYRQCECRNRVQTQPTTQREF